MPTAGQTSRAPRDYPARVPFCNGVRVLHTPTTACRFTADALAGLGDFSHVEVVFHFHRIAPHDVVSGLRHPRGRTDWPKVGIFAQRGRNRPNRLGVSIAEVIAIDGTTLTLRGLDAIDGTPVLDIKPYMAEFGPRGDVLQPAWSSELMAGYWTLGPDKHPKVDAERWLAEVLRSPSERGRLELLVRRPASNEREVLQTGELDPIVGLVGDNWLALGSRSSADGAAEPDAQLNLMNSRCARLVAGGDERMPLAGDQLFVDLDLSAEAADALIAFFAEPHNADLLQTLSQELTIAPYEAPRTVHAAIAGKTVVFTGTLARIGRKEAKAQAEALGAKVPVRSRKRRIF